MDLLKLQPTAMNVVQVLTIAISLRPHTRDRDFDRRLGLAVASPISIGWAQRCSSIRELAGFGVGASGVAHR